MAKRRNPQTVTVVTADDEEVAAGNPLPVTLAAADLGVGRVKVWDGIDSADVLDLTNFNGLAVAIVDGSGDQITSFGGGTQYTEGDTDASITGTAMLMEGAANALVVAQGTAADGLLVNLGANNDVTVSGVATSAKQDDQTTALQLIDNIVAAVDDVAGATQAGVPALAVRDDSLTTLTEADGDLTLLRTDNGGRLWARIDSTSGLATSAKQDTIITAVQLIDDLQAGMTIFRSIDIDESEEEVKGTAGRVHSVLAFNTTAAPLFLKFYNDTAANVIVGTTAPVLTFVVPGNADSDGAGFVWESVKGFVFSAAITVACTTGVADADTGAPGANAAILNVGYV